MKTTKINHNYQDCNSRSKWLFITFLIIAILYLILSFGRCLTLNSISDDCCSSSKILDNKNTDQVDINLLKQKLIKAVIDKNLFYMWRVQGVYVNPQFPKRFYYSENSGQSMRIGYIDLTEENEKSILNDEYPDIGISSTVWIYEKQKPVAEFGENEFRIIGFDGNKLVFYEINSSDTPGVCANEWIRTSSINQYLDISKSDSLPKKYSLSLDQKKKYEEEELNCIRDNS